MPVTTEITTQYDTTTVPTLNWTGNWTSATAYNPGDVAFYSGSSYVCVTANTNSAPPNINWNLVAQQGIQGPQGIPGPTGPTGATGATGPIGPVGMTWRGAYAGATTYSANDVVSSGGATYIATGTTTGTAPPAAPWSLVAAQGGTGPTGATGPQGPQGNQGIQGPVGSTGNTGPQGPVGPQGAAGTPGPNMNWRGTWNSGATYATYDAVSYLGSSFMATAPIGAGFPPPGTNWQLLASVGATGPTGPTGPQGAAGATGATGPQGPVGPQGPQGPQGPIGITGTTGSAGPAGVQGPAGPAGPTGATGAVGATGAAGAVGPTGPTGPMGPQGQPGLGLNVKGTVPTYSALPSAGNATNDTWVTVDTGHMWVWSGSAWVDTGITRGPTGPQGPQGATGPQGPTGPSGANGPTGPAGPVGPQGVQGPQGAQGIPGSPYSVPSLAIGVVVHWRPFAAHEYRYGVCKPAIVTEVFDINNNIVNAVVLGSSGGPVLLYDHIPTGNNAGQWHFIANCPYPMAAGTSLAQVFSTNGVSHDPVPV